MTWRRALLLAALGTSALASEPADLARAESKARELLASKHAKPAQAAAALANLGLVLAEKGDAARAEKALAAAEAKARAAQGAKGPLLMDIVNRRAAIATLRGDHQAALEHARRLLALREANLPPDHNDIGSAVFAVAEALTRLGKHAEAKPFYDRAAAMARKAFSPSHPALRAILRARANNAIARGAHREAADALAPVLAEAPPPEDRGAQADWASTALVRAEALEKAQAWPEAVSAYRSLLATQEKFFGADNPLLTDTLESLARVLRSANRDAEAADVERRAERLAKQ